MRKGLFMFAAILLTLFPGVTSSRNVQDNPTHAEQPERLRRQLAISLLRQINTAEVVDISTYGSYSSWPILLARYQKYFDSPIAKSYLREASVQFADAPEILPGWSLRLNVHADGKGYDLLLRDLTDSKC